MARTPAYLALYRASARQGVLTRLGQDPPLAAVAADLLRDDKAQYVDNNLRFRVDFGLFPARPDVVGLTPASLTDSHLKWRDVVDLVPSTFHVDHPPSGFQVAPGDPDRCYLDLFAVHERRAASDALGRRPQSALVATALLLRRWQANDRDSFVVSVGVPAGVRWSDKFLSHVTALPRGRASLDAPGALRWVPAATRLGALDAPASVPGTVQNPLVRKFTWRVGSVHPTANLAATGVSAHTRQFDPMCGPVALWAKWFDCVRWRSLVVHFVPLDNARVAHVDLHLAWFPAHRAAPATDAEMESFPGHRHLSLAPFEEGCRPERVSVPCEADDGVSFQVVPAPQYGGTARLALYFVITALPNSTIAAKASLWDVDFEAVADASVPA